MKVKVTTHDKEEYVTEVEGYGPEVAERLTQELQDNTKRTVVIGSLILQRSLVRSVIPIQDLQEKE